MCVYLQHIMPIYLPSISLSPTDHLCQSSIYHLSPTFYHCHPIYLNGVLKPAHADSRE